MARVRAHPRSMVPNGLPLRYFRLPTTQPLRLALVNPTDRYLRDWKPRYAAPIDHYLCFPASFAPSSSSNCRLHHHRRNEKLRLRSCSLEPNLTVIRKAPTERKMALETTGSTTIRL